MKSDIESLFNSPLDDPYQGDKIAENIYKVRLAIKSKGRGKSGGARVINYLDIKIIEDLEEVGIFILTIYDKSDAESISTNFVKKMIEEIKEE
ncbi:MAG: addiction module toxin RelE [Saprospiraceae bacterium]